MCLRVNFNYCILHNHALYGVMFHINERGLQLNNYFIAIEIIVLCNDY